MSKVRLKSTCLLECLFIIVKDIQTVNSMVDSDVLKKREEGLKNHIRVLYRLVHGFKYD